MHFKNLECIALDIQHGAIAKRGIKLCSSKVKTIPHLNNLIKPIKRNVIFELVTDESELKFRFRLLDCSVEPFQNLLGEKEPSIHTLKMTLCNITERIKDYIHCIYYNERIIQKKREKSNTSRLKTYTVHIDTKEQFVPTPIKVLVSADTCPACVETRWLSRVSDTPEIPFSKAMSLKALAELAADPAYVRSDRVHTLTECRVPASRVVLARRYLQQ